MGPAGAFAAKAIFLPHLIGALPFPLRHDARFERLNAIQDRVAGSSENKGEPSWNLPASLA
jgi:hypothetical protein